MFNGFFNDLTPEVCSALLSCFVFEEKSFDAPTLSDDISVPFNTLKETARMIAKVQIESRLLGVIEEEYVNKFKPTLAEAVLAWAKGSKFEDIWYFNLLCLPY